MTSDELVKILLQYPDVKVKVEFRFKTGYDEGTIYELSPTGFTAPDKDHLLIKGTFKPVGGW